MERVSTVTRERKKPSSERQAAGGALRIPADRELIVTIDGPAGTGKSTVARLLAKRLGLDFLDTGAMYRAAAAIALDRGIDPADPDRLLDVVSDADIHFDWSADPPAVLAWFKPINGRIRDADVTALVSTVAGIGRLREHMVRKQRLIGAQHPRLVTEGRDQGSVVFPDAPVKFYLDADPRVRAERRAEQFRDRDPDVAIDLDTLLADIQRRDHLDSSRADGPLRCPDDAERIDTGPLALDAVVALLAERVHTRLATT